MAGGHCAVPGCGRRASLAHHQRAAPQRKTERRAHSARGEYRRAGLAGERRDRAMIPRIAPVRRLRASGGRRAIVGSEQRRAEQAGRRCRGRGSTPAQVAAGRQQRREHHRTAVCHQQHLAQPGQLADAQAEQPRLVAPLARAGAGTIRTSKQVQRARMRAVSKPASFSQNSGAGGEQDARRMGEPGLVARAGVPGEGGQGASGSGAGFGFLHGEQAACGAKNTRSVRTAAIATCDRSTKPARLAAIATCGAHCVPTGRSGVFHWGDASRMICRFSTRCVAKSATGADSTRQPIMRAARLHAARQRRISAAAGGGRRQTRCSASRVRARPASVSSRSA